MREAARRDTGGGLKLGFGLFLVAMLGALAFFLRGHDTAALLAARESWMDWAAAHPYLAAAGYFSIYLVVTAVSLPGALVLSLIGGSLFGLWAGTLLTSFASTSGATLAMLSSRYLFRDFVAGRFSGAIARIDAGIGRDGARYLFGLRLVPLLPFFLVNLAMGLTRMPVFTYFWVSQIAMLPATLLYTNAGVELVAIDHVRDILSPRVIIAFTALALLPFVAKWGFTWWSDRARLARWKRPSRFEYNLVVIGGGAAGLVSAYLAAAAKAKVALIEAHEMGGDCLNTGCVPSKTLIRSARLAHEGGAAADFGLSGRLEPDFPAIMARIRAVIARIAPYDSEERYRGLGVDVIKGAARVLDPWRVEVGGRVLTSARIVLATGAAPVVPPLPGLAEAAPLTSETLWNLESLPARLLVLGAGAIGCELAQAFARLGSKVTLVEAMDRPLPGEDEDVGAALRAALEADGVHCVFGRKAREIVVAGHGFEAVLEDDARIGFDKVLIALGRAPRLSGFGLEELGIVEKGRLIVDARLRTPIATIYAAGDVLGQRQFTHAAAHYAWYAAMNSLVGFKRWAVNMEAFPAIVYTEPEVARLGLSRREAEAKNQPFEETRIDLAEHDRGIVEGAGGGFLSVLTPPGSDRILGVTIVGARAGEMLGEFTLAMRHGLGLGKIFRTIHPYPGWTEAAKTAAGAWRRDHVPRWLPVLSARFMAWRRG